MTDRRTTSEASEGSWSIGPRELPPPHGASEELRTILAGESTPVAADAPATAGELKTFAATKDATVTAVVKQAAAKLQIEIDETTLGGVPVFRITPPAVADAHRNRLFVHVHGGAWVKGAGLAAVAEAVEIAFSIGMPVLSIDYRMAPDHPAPAAVEDVVAVWREVIADRPPTTTALGGTSAGANIVLASMLKIKDDGVPIPAALFVGTPACELTKHGDMRFINEGIDHHLTNWDKGPAQAAGYYAGDKSYDDPSISPIYGDFNGFPPTYLISGTRDLMLSDTVRTHRKLRQAGVEADLHVYEGIAHADYILLINTPESQEHYRELNAFLSRHLRA